jgi:plastocyanin
MQSDGNLVIYSNGTALWTANSGQLSTPAGRLNQAIFNHAEQYSDGAWGDQCLIWVRDVIASAGGPQLAFGLDGSTYQRQWAGVATQVPSLAQAQPGDIVQWYNSSGVLHTAIYTAAGGGSVIDSNFTRQGTVWRGSFASRQASLGNSYMIWRLN